MIEVRGVTKRFDDRTVLDSVSLDIARGEIYALLARELVSHRNAALPPPHRRPEHLVAWRHIRRAHQHHWFDAEYPQRALPGQRWWR